MIKNQTKNSPHQTQPTTFSGFFKWLKPSLLATVFSAALATTAAADYELNLSAILSTNGLAQEVAIGDVSGDGLNDIVVVNNGYSGGSLTNHVLIYLGHINGGITSPTELAYSNNSSGQRGLVLLNADQDDALEVFIGHGKQLTLVNQDNQGLFTLFTTQTTYNNHVLGSIDVNLDGHQELVAIQSSGAFSPAVFYDAFSMLPLLELDLSSQGGQFEVTSSDVTGDGLDDLLVINQGSSLYPDLSVYEHDGVAGFIPATSYSVGINNELVSGLAAGDFNADGLNDVLLTQDTGADASLFLQDGMADLWLADSVSTLAGAEQAVASDLNADGLTDITIMHTATANNSAAVGYILQSTAGLQSEQWMDLPSPLIYDLQSLAVGDINHDGCADAVLADYNQGLVMLSGTGCQTGADLSVDLRSRGNLLMVRGFHLAGLDVNKARIRVDIETEQPVRFYAEGCRMKQLKPGNLRAICRIGSLSAGEKVGFNFWADTSQLPSPIVSMTVTATISSESDDPNPDNNTQVYIKQ